VYYRKWGLDIFFDAKSKKSTSNAGPPGIAFSRELGFLQIPMEIPGNFVNIQIFVFVHAFSSRKPFKS